MGCCKLGYSDEAPPRSTTMALDTTRKTTPPRSPVLRELSRQASLAELYQRGLIGYEKTGPREFRIFLTKEGKTELAKIRAARVIQRRLGAAISRLFPF